jgi:PAS domain S-box-containing protein
MSYSLSFAPQDEFLSDFAKHFGSFPDNRMKKQLDYSEDQLRLPTRDKLDTLPLPQTLEDALRPSLRAIVITYAKSPFHIFDVNTAWESLCGYSHIESRGKTLGSLLRGPETDGLAATGLITHLLQGEEEAATTLTNYTKSGRRFRNRVRVGPLLNNGKITHFVGILQEVKEDM